MLRSIFNLVYLLAFLTSALITYRWLDAHAHLVPDSREAAMAAEARVR